MPLKPAMRRRAAPAWKQWPINLPLIVRVLNKHA